MLKIRTFYLLLFILIFTRTNNWGQTTTQLSSAFCPGTVSSMGSNITCVGVSGAIGYRFEVSNMSNIVIGTYNGYAAGTTNKFRFSWMSGCVVSYGTTYKIRVAFTTNGATWSAYGSTCQVTTPTSPIQINPIFCSTTIASMGSSITCLTNQMCGHRFQVTDQSTGIVVGVYDAIAGAIANPGRSKYEFRFSWMPGLINVGTIYTINVAFYNGTTATWSPYGPGCDIETPTPVPTELTTTFCNDSAIATIGTNIYCDPVPGTIQYQFIVTNSTYGPIATLNKSTNSFKLQELTAQSSAHPMAGLQYDVVVKTKQLSTDPFDNPGNSCFVKLVIPTTTISTNDCGRTINYLQQDTLFSVPLSGVQFYKYRLFDGATYLYDSVVTPSSYNGITLRKFPGIQYCKTYSISVKVKMNGTWSQWGPDCSISTECNPTTELRPGFCGSTVSSCMTNIYVNSLIYGTPYRYSVQWTHPTLGLITDSVDMVGSGFKLSNLPQASKLVYNTFYFIKCKVYIGGAWKPWGPGCFVLLNTSSSLTGFCNLAVTTMGTNVYSSSVGCALDYKFRLNGPGLSNYEHNPSTMTNRFQPSQLISAGIQYNQTYTVEVAYLVNAAAGWSAYGTSCTITTPSAMMPDETIYELNGTAKEFNEGENMENTNQNNLSEDVQFEFVIFPNPTNNDFTLTKLNDLTFRSNIRIIDQFGKTIEQWNANEIHDGITFGSSYPQGFYFVEFECENIRKSFKLGKI